jgi:EmrB/QacA subfamily drug resistance transporter
MARVQRKTVLGRFFTGRPSWGLLTTCLGTLLVPFDAAVNVAFAPIVCAFALPILAIQWVVISYTLTYASLMLVFGRIGDMLGYRRLFLIGTGWSAAAFALCAAAPSFGWLLAARVLQGVGAALVLSCGPALATSLYEEELRPRVLGLYTMVFGIGGALGPVLAGPLVEYWGWSAVFAFRVPIALAAFALAWGLPVVVRPAIRESFDAVGAGLLVLAIGMLLLALNQLQHLEQPVVWLMLLGTASVLAATGFVAQERRAPRPIIDMRFFRDMDFALLNLAHALLNLAGFAVMLLVPFYLARVGALSITASGFMLAASPFGIALAAPMAGRLAGHISQWRLAVIGAAAMVVGEAAIGMVGAEPRFSMLLSAMALQGFGMGLFQVAYFDIATATIPRQNRGVAGSLVMMTRTLGIVIGATTLMLIFHRLQVAAADGGATEAQAFLAGFQGVFRFAAAIPVLAIACALLRGWWSFARLEAQRDISA